MQANPGTENGIYEDWESFSDTDRILQQKGRTKLPKLAKRLPEGGVALDGFDLPDDLPRYRQGVEIEYCARRKATALRMRNIHVSKEGRASRESMDAMPYFNESDCKRPRRLVDGAECARMLYVWGGNMCNQLAIDNLVDQAWVTRSPLFRPGGPLHGRIDRIFAGGFHSVCVLKNPVTTVAFGYNRFGQLGVGPMPNGPWHDGTSLNDPADFSKADADRVREVLGEDWCELVGSARDWYGSLDVDMCNVPKPAQVVGLEDCEVRDVACGLFHTLFLARPAAGDGLFRVLACGNNDAGQLGQVCARACATCSCPSRHLNSLHSNQDG